MKEMKRTVTCGELNKEFTGKIVVLNGWVHRVRDHGGVKFINLRDRYGITQIVIDLNIDNKLTEMAEQLKLEYCIAVKGIVIERPLNMINKDMLTGEIELHADELVILSKCEVLPFMIDEKSDAREDLRFKYRYLDLRSFSMQKNIRLRHEVAFSAREYLKSKGFYEIETPSLIKSTPEGARDFIVPSRIHKGKCYALPQSPQLYKQLLMVSGFDKYFQIAHCFRDEDARGDRQPEHSQIDIEMSFVSKEDVFELIEGLFNYIFKSTIYKDDSSKRINTPFKKLTYAEAMELYGSDKPDLRFDLKFQNFAPFVPKGNFQVFKDILGDNDDTEKRAAAKGAVKAIVVPDCAHYSRKNITDLEEVAKVYGARGLAWMKVTENGLEGGISKFYSEDKELEKEILSTLNAKKGDLILFVGSDWKTVCASLGAVRNQLGKDLKLIDPEIFEFCWIIDFPMFEWNEDAEKWDTAHHMFTMPQAQYLDTLEENPEEVKGDLYDLVCNGVELASGSIRIHDPELQKRIFNIVGFEEEETKKRFGFLLEAFKYGPPPHGGIAPGLDRLLMLMAGESTIRDVIAFPKNTVGASPMDDCPSEIDEAQLKELGIKIIEKD